MRIRRVCALVTALALLGAPAPADRTVTFPLVVDYDLLASAARTALGFEAGGEAVLWGTAGGCHSLVIDDVGMERAAERVRVTLHGRARVGPSLFGFCLFPLRWEGYVETLGRSEVGRDWQVRLRDPESTLLDHNRQRTAVASRLWGLVRDRVEERLGTFTFDLGPPIGEASALVRASVPPERAAPVLTALASLRPTGISVDDEGVKVEAAMEVPDAPAATAPPEPALTPAEL